MTRYIVFETRTGRILNEFQPVTGPWSVSANDAEKITVTLNLDSEENVELDWKNLGTPWKHSIAVEESGRLLGGPIMPHDWDEDSLTLTLTARGVRVLLATRTITPVAALTNSLLQADGLPDPAMDTIITGFDYGTIGKKLIQQAMEWPGFDLPIVFHADRAGTREQTYAALDRKWLDDALSDLSGLENGPDIRLQLTRVDDEYLQWVYESGTETQPRLQSASVVTWDMGAEDLVASGLSASTNPTRMVSLSWATAGRTEDSALVSVAYDPYLINQGFPLMELVDSSHSNVNRQETLDAWALEPLRTGRKPSEFWSFDARLDGYPPLGDYNWGDLADINVDRSPYLPVGSHRRRIAALAGDEKGESVKITCGEVYDG